MTGQSVAKSFKSRIVALAIKASRRPERIDKRGASWRYFERTRRIMAHKKVSIFDQLRLGVGLLLNPNAVKRGISYVNSSKVRSGRRRYALLSFSDTHGEIGEQMRWGDFWIKQELTAAITELGGVVVEPFMAPDVVVHLFGGYYDLPHAEEHVLWVHSHPEWLNRKFLERYDRVYTISKSECRRLAEMGITSEWLPMATGKQSVVGDVKYQRQVVFVGNALPELNGHRRVVDDMLQVMTKHPEIEFKVWGGLYQSLPQGVHQGNYLPYSELDRLYSESAIVLNDHRPEMREHGFINPRILDVIASGGFVVSDKNVAIEEYFGDCVPQYDGGDELGKLVISYLNSDELRRKRVKGAQARLSDYNWRRVADTLMREGRE